MKAAKTEDQETTKKSTVENVDEQLKPLKQPDTKNDRSKTSKSKEKQINSIKSKEKLLNSSKSKEKLLNSSKSKEKQSSITLKPVKSKSFVNSKMNIDKVE